MSGVALAFCSPFEKEVKVRTLCPASEEAQCPRCHFPSGAESSVVRWSDTHLTCSGTHQNACAQGMGWDFLVIHGVLLVVHDEWKEGLGVWDKQNSLIPRDWDCQHLWLGL